MYHGEFESWSLSEGVLAISFTGCVALVVERDRERDRKGAWEGDGEEQEKQRAERAVSSS